MRLGNCIASLIGITLALAIGTFGCGTPAGAAPTTALPVFPADLAWPAKVRPEIAAAVQLFSSDPVTAYLLLEDGLASLLSEPVKDEDQRRWLQSAVDSVRSYVREQVEDQYRRSLVAEDLRGAAIARQATMIIDSKHDDDVALLAPRPGWEAMDELVSRTIDAQIKREDIWQLSDVTGEHITDYRETFGIMQATYRPAGEGQDLLRIRAKVVNRSTSGDPAYAVWVLPASYRPFFRIDNPDSLQVSDRRLASGYFLFVTTSEASYPCGFVTRQASSVLRGGGGFEAMAFVLGTMLQKGIPPPGSYVSPGAEFELDVLCSVPRDIREPRFMFLGSAPVRVSLAQSPE